MLRGAVRELPSGRRVVRRFCLGPFQDAVLHAARGHRSAKRVALEYGVEHETLRAWRDWARYHR